MARTAVILRYPFRSSEYAMLQHLCLYVALFWSICTIRSRLLTQGVSPRSWNPPLSFLWRFIFILCVWASACICVRILYSCLVPVEPRRRGKIPLKLKGQIVEPPFGCWNEAWIFYTNSKCSWPLGPLSSPPVFFGLAGWYCDLEREHQMWRVSSSLIISSLHLLYSAFQCYC